MYSTLKSCIFGSIEPILIFLGVLKSSGPILSHSGVYFPGKFRERSAKFGWVCLNLRWSRFSKLMFFRDILPDRVFSVFRASVPGWRTAITVSNVRPALSRVTG